MKKIFYNLFIILILCTIIGCAKPVEARATTQPLNNGFSTDLFWNLVCLDNHKSIYYETNTDVMYRRNEISGAHAYLGEVYLPIYKPDGTCLTYTEWKSSHGVY